MKGKKIGRLVEPDHWTLVLWAADCTQRVLPYLDALYPRMTSRARHRKQGAPGRVARSR